MSTTARRVVEAVRAEGVGRYRRHQRHHQLDDWSWETHGGSSQIRHFAAKPDSACTQAGCRSQARPSSVDAAVHFRSMRRRPVSRRRRVPVAVTSHRRISEMFLASPKPRRYFVPCRTPACMEANLDSQRLLVAAPRGTVAFAVIGSDRPPRRIVMPLSERSRSIGSCSMRWRWSVASTSSLRFERGRVTVHLLPQRSAARFQPAPREVGPWSLPYYHRHGAGGVFPSYEGFPWKPTRLF